MPEAASPTNQMVSWVVSQGRARQVANNVVFTAAEVNSLNDDLCPILASRPSEKVFWLKQCECWNHNFDFDTDKSGIFTQFVVVTTVTGSGISWKILGHRISLRYQGFPVMLIPQFDVATSVESKPASLNDEPMSTPVWRNAFVELVFIAAG